MNSEFPWAEGAQQFQQIFGQTWAQALQSFQKMDLGGQSAAAPAVKLSPAKLQALQQQYLQEAQELWAQHKYSVMARSPRTYQTLGRSVARMRNGKAHATLLQELTWILRDTPGEGRLLNAVEHMWGYVRDHATADDIRMARMSIGHLLARTQRLAVRRRQRFLLSSTALSELAVFVDLDDRWPDGQDLG